MSAGYTKLNNGFIATGTISEQEVLRKKGWGEDLGDNWAEVSMLGMSLKCFRKFNL